MRWVPVMVDELDAANAWGLRHMSGNIEEVTMSCWSDRHMPWSLASQYLEHALQVSSCVRRVTRGGAHSRLMDESRPAARTRAKEDLRLPMIGFRVLREMRAPDT